MHDNQTMTVIKSVGPDFISDLLGYPKPTGSLVEPIIPSHDLESITPEAILLRRELLVKLDGVMPPARNTFPGWEVSVQADEAAGNRVVFRDHSDTRSSAVAISADSRRSDVSIVSEMAGPGQIQSEYLVEIQELHTTPTDVFRRAGRITVEQRIGGGTITKIDHIKPFTIGQWSTGVGELESGSVEPAPRSGLVNWLLGRSVGR